VAVKTTFSDLQSVVFEPLIIGATVIQPAQSLVIIKVFDALLSPQIFLQVAVYDPAVLTLILVVVAPVLHFTLPLLQFDAVKVVVDVVQRLVFSVLIIGGVTFSLLLLVFVQ
jgi:hypothetical protein